MAKIQKIFNISFVLNKKVLILFNTMNKMNKISTFLKCTQLIIHSEVPERDDDSMPRLDIVFYDTSVFYILYLLDTNNPSMRDEFFRKVPSMRDEFKHFYPSLGDFCTLCHLRM